MDWHAKHGIKSSLVIGEAEITRLVFAFGAREHFQQQAATKSPALSAGRSSPVKIQQ